MNNTNTRDMKKGGGERLRSAEKEPKKVKYVKIIMLSCFYNYTKTYNNHHNYLTN